MSKKSSVNKSGNYTKPSLRKRIFNRIKNQASHGTRGGQWSAKSSSSSEAYKKAGGDTNNGIRNEKSFIPEICRSKKCKKEKEEKEKVKRNENSKAPKVPLDEKRKE